MADSVLPENLLEQALDEVLRLMRASELESQTPEVSIDLVMAMARGVDSLEQMAHGYDAVPASSVLH
jgi:hypothetical protein